MLFETFDEPVHACVCTYEIVDGTLCKCVIRAIIYICSVSQEAVMPVCAE